MEKVALVTGGSRGIGKEICLGLAEDGFNVAFTYSRNEEEAQRTLEEIIKKGVKALSLKAEVSSFEQMSKALADIESNLGHVNVLVNNAGITKDKLLIKMDSEDWDSVINTNLKGTFVASKAVIKSMMKNRYGKIINISSVVGLMGNAGQANYSASKAGVIGLTKSMAKEFAKRGIRVNAIAPGFIQTDMTERLSVEVKEKMLSVIPLGYFANPKAVSDLVNFLAGDKSDYITGEVIQIDGGMNI